MISVSSTAFLGQESAYLADCVANNWITQGSYARRFEDGFARFCDTDFALSCSSGTAALHLALKAVDVQPDDAVFVPALTYVATANAVEYCGACPLFVDVDRDTWCIDPVALRIKIESARQYGWKLKAIIAVHLFGALAPMAELRALANEFDMVLIEDASQAHGASDDGSPAGSLADVGTFSFYGNKILTCGEGGMVTTDDAKIADSVSLYRAQGARTNHRFFHSVIGFNYRLTDMAAAVGCAQLETYEQHRARRAGVRERYISALGTDERVTFQTIRPDTVPADWLVSCLLPKNTDRNAVIAKLAARGVETRPFFVPLPMLPMYLSEVPPNTHDIASRGISLPTHANLSMTDVDTVCEFLQEACS